MKDNDPMLTPREASRFLGVHPNTLRRWSNDRLLKTYRIGSRRDRRFRQSELVRFLGEAVEPAAPEKSQ